MKISSLVIISNLYPNALETTKGLFIKQLTESLADKVSVTVIAPVPFNPLEYLTRMPRVATREVIGDVEVLHPRYIVIPRMLRSLTGFFFYLGIRKSVKELINQGEADALSVHWVYPDGFGAVLAAKKFGLPVAVHALGCDINEYTKFKIRRKLIRYTLQQSSMNIVKSKELKDKITHLGVEPNKTHVILNGIDKNRFHQRDPANDRLELELSPSQKYLLFIGNFQIEKGLDILLNTLKLIEDQEWHLLVIGGGPLEFSIKQQIKTLNLESRVSLLGRVPHRNIPVYLSAVDLLCLPSLREGCPNVVLESLSCGTPVVASRVGAVPDIITQKEFGFIVEAENPPALAKGITEGLALNKSEMPLFNWYDWNDNAEKVLARFESLS